MRTASPASERRSASHRLTLTAGCLLFVFCACVIWWSLNSNPVSVYHTPLDASAGTATAELASSELLPIQIQPISTDACTFSDATCPGLPSHAVIEPPPTVPARFVTRHRYTHLLRRSLTADQLISTEPGAETDNTLGRLSAMFLHPPPKPWNLPASSYPQVSAIRKRDGEWPLPSPFALAPGDSTVNEILEIKRKHSLPGTTDPNPSALTSATDRILFFIHIPKSGGYALHFIGCDVHLIARCVVVS